MNNNVNHEGEKKGAIGDIQFFLDNVDTAELLILASDNVFDFKLKDLKEFSDEKNKSCVALVKIEDESLVKKYSCVLMNEDNKIHFFEEKPENPKSNLCGTPFYLLKEHDVKKVKENKFEKIDNMGNLIEFLHKKSEVYGKVFDDFWMDVGTKEELDKVNN